MSTDHPRRQLPRTIAADPSATRLPPHNLDAEQRVLAAILDETSEGRFLVTCRSRHLRAADFFNSAHQIIAEAVFALDDAGEPVDSISVPERLHRMGELQAVGGPSYINEVLGTLDALLHRKELDEHAEHWLEIVLEKSRRRRLSLAALALSDKAHDPVADISAATSGAIADLCALERSTEGDTETCRQVAEAVLQKSLLAFADREPPPTRVVSWGVPGWDEAFGPLCAEEGDGLVIVAARSGIGKSSAARQQAFHLLRTDPDAVAQVFLLETMPQQFYARCAGLESGIPYKESLNNTVLRRWRYSERRLKSIRTGEQHGYPKAGESFEAFQKRAEEAAFANQSGRHMEWMRKLVEWSDKRLFVRAHSFKVDRICAQARATHRLTGRTDLVLVDYLQIVDVDDAKGKRGDEIIKRIAMAFKELAKELRCPVVVIAAVTMEDDTIPGLESLRGSKDAGYAADRIITLHRPKKDAAGADQTDDRAVFHVEARQVKARDNGTHTLWCGFVRELTKFIAPERHFGASSATGDGFARGRGRPLGSKDSAPRAAYGSLKEERAAAAAKQPAAGFGREANDDRPWSDES